MAINNEILKGLNNKINGLVDVGYESSGGTRFANGDNIETLYIALDKLVPMLRRHIFAQSILFSLNKGGDSSSEIADVFALSTLAAEVSEKQGIMFGSDYDLVYSDVDYEGVKKGWDTRHVNLKTGALQMYGLPGIISLNEMSFAQVGGEDNFFQLFSTTPFAYTKKTVSQFVESEIEKVVDTEEVENIKSLLDMGYTTTGGTTFDNGDTIETLHIAIHEILPILYENVLPKLTQNNQWSIDLFSTTADKKLTLTIYRSSALKPEMDDGILIGAALTAKSNLAILYSDINFVHSSGIVIRKGWNTSYVDLETGAVSKALYSGVISELTEESFVAVGGRDNFFKIFSSTPFNVSHITVTQYVGAHGGGPSNEIEKIWSLLDTGYKTNEGVRFDVGYNVEQLYIAMSALSILREIVKENQNPEDWLFSIGDNSFGLLNTSLFNVSSGVMFGDLEGIRILYSDHDIDYHDDDLNLTIKKGWNTEYVNLETGAISPEMYSGIVRMLNMEQVGGADKFFRVFSVSEFTTEQKTISEYVNEFIGSGIEGDLSNYYTKTEVDEIMNGVGDILDDINGEIIDGSQTAKSLYLRDTKTGLGDVIASRSGTVPATFRGYIETLNQMIGSGSGGGEPAGDSFALNYGDFNVEAIDAMGDGSVIVNLLWANIDMRPWLNEYFEDVLHYGGLTAQYEVRDRHDSLERPVMIASAQFINANGEECQSLQFLWKNRKIINMKWNVGETEVPLPDLEESENYCGVGIYLLDQNYQNIVFDKIAFEEKEYPTISRLTDGTINVFTIPDDVTKIRPYCFYGTYDLRKIQNFPNNVTEIGEFAFLSSRCFENEDLIISPEIKRANLGAFKDTRMKSLEIFIGSQHYPELGGTDFQNSVFLNCGELEKVYAHYMTPDATLPQEFFGYCPNLRTYNSATEGVCDLTGLSIMWDSAFESCGFQTVRLASGLALEGGRQFMHCQNLIDVIIACSLPTYGEHQGTDNFAECGNLQTVVFEDTASGELFHRMFANCDIQSITLPQNVRLGANKYSVFEGNANLYEVKIQSSENWFEGGVFGNCQNLRRIIIEGSVVQTGMTVTHWGYGTPFERVRDGEDLGFEPVIYVPDADVQAYKDEPFVDVAQFVKPLSELQE